MDATPAAKPSPCELSIDRPGEDALVLKFAGNWRIGEDLPSVNKVLKQIDSNPGVKRISFDTRGLTGWDSSLLTFLIKVLDQCKKNQIHTDSEALPKGVKRLLALASAVPEREGARKVSTR